MSVTNSIVNTSHADIAVAMTSGEGLPFLFIHGNSSCKEVFRTQLEGDFGSSRRVIAMDLPGHGGSSDARDPARTYTMPGYADAAVELLDKLGIDRVAVVGWSLGGHAAMEMLPRFDGIVGMMVCGAPPVSPTMESLQSGFRQHPLGALLGKPEFSDDEVDSLSRACYGDAVNPTLVDAMRRADGRAREIMIQSLFTGQIGDQRALAVGASVPVAMVNGADDPFVNVEYVSSLPYANLWDQHCYVLRGAGHAAFLTNPASFDPILTRFADEMAGRAESRSHVKRSSRRPDAAA